jgi:hypothetical protein
MNLQEALQNQIKTGSVKQITAFGANKLGLPVPYVVIVPEPAAPDKLAFQIWAHFAIGQEREIQTYVLEELPDILGALKNPCGQNVFKIFNFFDGLRVDQADNTLRMGFAVYTPLVFTNRK